MGLGCGVGNIYYNSFIYPDDNKSARSMDHSLPHTNSETRTLCRAVWSPPRYALTHSWSSRNFRKIVIYRERSPNIAKDRAISRNIAQCRAISRNIAQYRAPSRRTSLMGPARVRPARGGGGGGSTGRFCKSLNIAINRQKSLKIAKDREISRRRYCEKFRLDQEFTLSWGLGDVRLFLLRKLTFDKKYK